MRNKTKVVSVLLSAVLTVNFACAGSAWAEAGAQDGFQVGEQSGSQAIADAQFVSQSNAQPSSQARAEIGSQVGAEAQSDSAMNTKSTLAANETASTMSIHLALGDSISYGYKQDGGQFTDSCFVNLLADKLGGAAINQSVSGNTSADLLKQLQTGEFDSAIEASNTISITCGGNDLLPVLYIRTANYYNANYASSGSTITASDVPKILSSESNSKQRDVVYSLVFSLSGTDTSDELKAAVSAFTANINQATAYIKNKNANANIYVATQYNPYEHFTGFYATYTAILGQCIQVLNSAITSNTTLGQYTVADVYTAFSGHTSEYCNASNPTSLTGAGLIKALDFHPTEAGHAAIADCFAKTINPALVQESAFKARNAGQVANEQTANEQTANEVVEAGQNSTLTGAESPVGVAGVSDATNGAEVVGGAEVSGIAGGAEVVDSSGDVEATSITSDVNVADSASNAKDANVAGVSNNAGGENDAEGAGVADVIVADGEKIANDEGVANGANVAKIASANVKLTETQNGAQDAQNVTSEDSDAKESSDQNAYIDSNPSPLSVPSVFGSMAILATGVGAVRSRQTNRDK